MNPLKKNIIMAAILTIIGVTIGIVVPTALAEKTSGVQVDQVKLEKIQQEQAKLEQTAQLAYKKELITAYIDQYEAAQVVKIKADFAKLYGSEAKIPEIKLLTPKEKTALVDSISASKDGHPMVKDAWLQKVIDEKRGLIDENDLVTGSGIYNQLDTGYLFGLADSGLDPVERQEAETYLHSKLSPEEFTTAIQIYMKYVELLN